MSAMHTIAHFLRLAPEVQRELAERFALTRPEDADDLPGNLPHSWLLRARDGGKLDELGTAVQLAPQ